MKPDYFELFETGRKLSPDTAALRKKYYELSRIHHPDRAPAGGQNAALQQTAAINEGFRVLGNESARLRHVLLLEGKISAEETAGNAGLPADFMMEMMDLNEAMEDDPAAAAPLLEKALAAWRQDYESLAADYDAGGASDATLDGLANLYLQRKYLDRLAGGAKK